MSVPPLPSGARRRSLSRQVLLRERQRRQVFPEHQLDVQPRHHGAGLVRARMKRQHAVAEALRLRLHVAEIDAGAAELEAGRAGQRRRQADLALEACDVGDRQTSGAVGEVDMLGRPDRAADGEPAAGLEIEDAVARQGEPRGDLRRALDLDQGIVDERPAFERERGLLRHEQQRRGAARRILEREVGGAAVACRIDREVSALGEDEDAPAIGRGAEALEGHVAGLAGAGPHHRQVDARSEEAGGRPQGDRGRVVRAAQHDELVGDGGRRHDGSSGPHDRRVAGLRKVVGRRRCRRPVRGVEPVAECSRNRRANGHPKTRDHSTTPAATGQRRRIEQNQHSHREARPSTDRKSRGAPVGTTDLNSSPARTAEQDLVPAGIRRAAGFWHVTSLTLHSGLARDAGLCDGGHWLGRRPTSNCFHGEAAQQADRPRHRYRADGDWDHDDLRSGRRPGGRSRSIPPRCASVRGRVDGRWHRPRLHGPRPLAVRACPRLELNDEGILYSRCLQATRIAWSELDRAEIQRMSGRGRSKPCSTALCW